MSEILRLRVAADEAEYALRAAIREHEPRTRTHESWWVVDGIQSWSGGSEEEARKYQRRHGGSIQVTRLTETSYGYTALVSCPTCQGPSRETVGMVCQMCRTDYGSPAPVLRHYLSEQTAALAPVEPATEEADRG